MRNNEARPKLSGRRKRRSGLLKPPWGVQGASVDCIDQEAYARHSFLEFPPAFCLQVAGMFGPGTQRKMGEARVRYQRKLQLDWYVVAE